MSIILRFVRYLRLRCRFSILATFLLAFWVLGLNSLPFGVTSGGFTGECAIFSATMPLRSFWVLSNMIVRAVSD